MNRALDQAQSGDMLVVWKLNRISRSLQRVVQLLGGLREHGVSLRALTGEIDTTSRTDHFVFGIFSTSIEFERDLIHELTMAGLAAARVRHGDCPRMTKKSKLKVVMTLMADQENAAWDVAEQLGTSLSALYTFVDGKGRPKAQAHLLLGDINRPPSVPAIPPVTVRHSVEGR